MNYLGVSYLKDGEENITSQEINDWKLKNCPNGKHLWDEVYSSPQRHYLFCDACEKTRQINQEDIDKLKKGELN